VKRIFKHIIAWFGLSLPWILIWIYGYGHTTCFGGDEEFGPSSCYYFVDIITMVSLIVGILYFLWVYQEQYRIFGKYCNMIKDWLTPNHWAIKIAEKGLEKTSIREKAENSKLRKWIDNKQETLTGWKWILFNIVLGIVVLIIIELFANLLGLTILPWR